MIFIISLTSIVRKGTTGATIDNLSYNYNGNKINYVNDASGDYASTVDYPGDASSSTFAYDQNGNMEYEPSKGISLLYNLLNLPKEADFGTNRKINYFYTFDGEKVRQTVEDNGTLTKTDHCGPFVYESASGTRSLKYIVTPEGRAVKSGNSWDYEYNLKDHLGNTRAVIRSNSGVAQLIQERHYYPFGMEMSTHSAGTSTNKYLYNGKEYQDDFDLGWYDYGTRFYDPQLGRWQVIDPAIEDAHHDYAPYAYVYNNPMIYIDPMGLDSVYVFDQATRPEDNGVAGTSYTADVYVVQNGKLTYIGQNEKSTYPNSKSPTDNSTKHKTVKEGEHNFDNKYGHKKSSQKGLNIYDTSTREIGAIAADGTETTADGINDHSGKSNKGGYLSRGSTGCMTTNPSANESYLGMFDWSGTITRDGNTFKGTTGKSNGKYYIYRGTSNMPANFRNDHKLPVILKEVIVMPKR